MGPLRFRAILFFLVLLAMVLYESHHQSPRFLSDYIEGGSAVWKEQVHNSHKVRKEKAHHHCLGETCEVSNKETLLASVDALLAKEGEKAHPPAVEFIFVEPTFAEAAEGVFETFVNFCFGFGHAVLRVNHPYTDGDDAGDQYIVNICNTEVEGKKLVNFLHPTDYFFSLDEKTEQKSEQYGIYNRNYVGLRIESLSESTIESLHQYFLDLGERYQRGEADFSGSAIHSWVYYLQRSLGLLDVEKGNCGEWISRGLTNASITFRPRVFPKRILLDLARFHSDDTHLVYYLRAPHARRHPVYEGWNSEHRGSLHAMSWLDTLKFWDLTRYADVIVKVEGDKATVQQNNHRASSLGEAVDFGLVAGLWSYIQLELVLLGLLFFISSSGRGVVWVVIDFVLSVGGLFFLIFLALMVPPSLSLGIRWMWVVFEMIVMLFLSFPYLFASQLCCCICGLLGLHNLFGLRRADFDFFVQLCFWAIFHWSTGLFF